MATTYPPKIVRTEVRGLKVVKDEVLASNLPPKKDGSPVPMHGTRVLTMEDGSTLYGCGDCVEVRDTRGDIRRHHNTDHGLTRSHRPRKPATETDSPPLPIPGGEMLGMTVYELLELATGVEHWQQVFENQDQEIERLRALLTGKDQEVAEVRRQLKAEQRDHDRLKARLARMIGAELPAEAEATS